jgi:hypothetical protein
MAVYKFRVSFEEYDDIHRDIEIKSGQNFEQFHHCIQKAIGFDASKPASFYMSNDNWKKGQEFVFMPQSINNTEGRIHMKDARLSDYISDPHQKIYYVFDQPSQWTFFIELTKIMAEDPAKQYPVCVKFHNDAPKQYLKIEALKGAGESEIPDDEIFSEILAEEDDTISDDSDSSDSDDTSSDFSDEVDEEEFDNIQEGDEESERE